MLIDGKEEPLSDAHLKMFEQANEDFSNQALRVLAYGYRELPEGQASIDESDEYELTLVGLTAMIDPPKRRSL